jgi:hypothetical protein
MHEAFAQSDVVVGSHSTGVIEALMSLKPPIFFSTAKWGDYFEVKQFNSIYHIFANTPEELVNYARESKNISKNSLRDLQNMYFGDPYRNGGKWVVDQLESALRSGRITK